ncbi:hypothetical protein AB0323_00395 [Arthrobacter sp. NPDC080031]|uniref:hypothetical protein n=1 Tax=Arthrobacter sp. NPDC080031 TaxID=3155918 RepID=UPI003450E317
MIGVMAATALAAILTTQLSTEAMEAWGWRTGFALGAVLGIYALFLRRQAVESDILATDQAVSPLQKATLNRRDVLRFSIRTVLISAFAQVWFYILVTFPPATAIATKA